MLKIQKFNVQIELTEPMLGTVPKDPNIYTQYIASKAPSEFLACEEIDLETVSYTHLTIVKMKKKK